jgi:Phosphotransferase enzyme family
VSGPTCLNRLAVPDSALPECGWQDLGDWCRRELRSDLKDVLFVRGHYRNVLGVELDDGRRAVVKLREPNARIEDVLAVQRRLFHAGFPCPEPMSGASALGPWVASAETYVRAGEPRGTPPAREAARTLANLVSSAGNPLAHRGLLAPLPWAAWDHAGPGLWPVPDDLDVDLNDPPGPSWLQDAAVRARHRLEHDESPDVIGHCDWEAHNLGWDDHRIAVVYDWDSLLIRTEPAVAGLAAAVFASTPAGPVAANMEQSESFLHEYLRGRPEWDSAAEEVAWAAGLWPLLYNARKELAGGGAGYVAHLRKELVARLDRAGA